MKVSVFKYIKNIHIMISLLSAQRLLSYDIYKEIQDNLDKIYDICASEQHHRNTRF